MSELRVYDDQRIEEQGRYTAAADIERELAAIGVQFERWQADQALAADAGQDAILAAYAEPVARLKKQYGFQSADVVSLQPDHPQKDEFRRKFLDEHVHSDFEVRFFVDGSGLFYIHASDKVYAMLCTRGDLISVPANTTHWFDMGTRPYFKCIRLFTTPEGWVAQFTGNDIAKRLPDFDHFVGAAG